MQRRVILLLAFLIALPVVGQAQRLVSKIEVRGNVPAGIVTSQTALTTGRSYSDRDLELAMARLRRLPFVFDASYSVDGDTLVVEVNPVTRFFGDVVATGAGYESNESFGAALAGGGRLFLGSNGVAEALVTQTITDLDDVTAADAEYGHYGIAGTRLWARARVGFALREESGVDSDPNLDLEVGYPLTLRQSLVLSHNDSGYTIQQSFPDSPGLSSGSDFNATSLLWRWDTTEDPYFMRHGETISAGPSWSKQSSRGGGYILVGPNGEPIFGSTRHRSETFAFGVEATKYFATGTRGAFYAGVGASRFDTEGELSGFPPEIGDMRSQIDGNAFSASAGYGHNLFDWDSRPGTRQRIEGGVTYRRNDIDNFVGERTIDSYGAEAAYVLRRNFATVRLQLFYTFD